MNISEYVVVIESLKQLKAPDSISKSDNDEIVIIYYCPFDPEKRQYLEIRLKDERCCLNYMNGDIVESQETISYMHSWIEYITVSITEYLRLDEDTDEV